MAQSDFFISGKETVKITTFDSGIGGFVFTDSLYKYLRDKKDIRSFEINHIADTKNLPYGSKTPDQISDFVTKAAAYALTNGADYFVICCNTASVFSDKSVIELQNMGFNDADKKVKCLRSFTYDLLEEYFLNQMKEYDDINLLLLQTPATTRAKNYIDAIKRIFELSEYRVIEKKSKDDAFYYLYEASHRSGKIFRLTQLAPKNWVELLEGDYSDEQLFDQIVDDISFIEDITDSPFQGVGLFCTHYPLLRPHIYQAMQERFMADENTKWLSQVGHFVHSMKAKLTTKKKPFLQKIEQPNIYRTEPIDPNFTRMFYKLFTGYKDTNMSLIEL